AAARSPIPSTNKIEIPYSVLAHIRTAKVRILVETRVGELGSEALHHRRRHVAPLHFLEIKIDAAVAVDCSEQISVDLLAHFAGTPKIVGYSVADGACRSHDPTRKHASVLVPIFAVV